MTARYIIGDTRQVLAQLADEGVQVDLVLTSPPFLALRSYLPDGDPAKALEIGSEATPGEFLDVLLDVVEACERILAPHGSIAVELGDTYAGSGGAGGDYSVGGLRDGQQKFDGTARKAKKFADYDRMRDEARAVRPALFRTRADRPGWPLDKSLCCIPAAFEWALAYGLNPWTGRTTDRWRVRNICPWIRPNPPVGDLGDKYRPATSYFTVATKARDRWFDLDAVRMPHQNDADAFPPRRTVKGSSREDGWGRPDDELKVRSNAAGAPPLDWWDPIALTLREAMRNGETDPQKLSYAIRDAEILDWGDAWWQPTEPYKGAHYATWPRQLCVRPVLSMCPERVCTTCGEPARRIVEEVSPRIVSDDDAGKDRTQGRSVGGAYVKSHKVIPAERQPVGWSDCGHGTYRTGVVLDPFAGSGTTLLVATGHGRDAIGIDIDHRNADLARERLGMFLDVEHAAPSGLPVGGPGMEPWDRPASGDIG